MASYLECNTEGERNTRLFALQTVLMTGSWICLFPRLDYCFQIYGGG